MHLSDDQDSLRSHATEINDLRIQGFDFCQYRGKILVSSRDTLKSEDFPAFGLDVLAKVLCKALAVVTFVVDADDVLPSAAPGKVRRPLGLNFVIPACPEENGDTAGRQFQSGGRR